MLGYAEKGELYLLAIIHQRLIISGDVELNPGPLPALDLQTITSELSSVMTKWYSIGIQLGVNQAKLKEIEMNHCNRTAADTVRCFSEVISFWLDGNTTVPLSWKSLVEILEQPFVGERGLAMRLREKIEMIVSETAGIPIATESEVQPQEINGGQRGNAEEKLDDSGDQQPEHQGDPEVMKAKLLTDTGYVAEEKVEKVLPVIKAEDLVRSVPIVDKPRLTFPLLDQVVEISKEEKERLKQRLYSESEDMMYKFQELFSATIKSLKERNVTVKELSNHIGCLVAIKPVYQDSKLGQLRCELPKAETIDDVMSIVREYSSFFNYRMLKNIIDHVGGEEDRKNLAIYLQEFAEYAKRKVYECPSEVGQISEAGRSNMFVTLDESYDNYTVSSLKNFERELAKILNISSDVVVVLCRIAPGSLQLTFQIPLEIQKTIFPLSSEEEVALTKLGVARLSCGEYCFANDSEETEDKGDHSSPEGDSDTQEQSTVADITGRGRGKISGSSSADSAIGTSRHSVASGANVTGISKFSEVLHYLSQAFQGWLSGSNSVTMLVTGKTGVGKSSLINGVIGKEVAEEGDFLDRGTVEVQAFAFKYHEVDITIWDSPGLQDGLDKEEEYIKDMQRKGCANSDLVLYCAKMTDTRFRKEDHDAIRKLTIGLGKHIWKNAIFVMTFANDIRARRERGQKLTPDEERKRNSTFFKQRIEEWRAKLVGAVTEAGVDAKVAASIPIVPAGYDQEQELPDRDNWLSPLWYASILRMKERSQPALLKANLHRIKLPDQITPKDFDKPLHEQPIVYVPAPVKYGAPPTVLTVIGAIVGGIAGPAGAVVGGVAGAALGAATDGLVAYFTSGASETTEPEADSKNGE